MSDAVGAGTPAGQQEVLAGRYRLVRRLADGGMATVWEGRDEILARPVAIKIPHTQLAADPASRERFRREAVAAARLAHPGIVATYDAGADGPTDFIVMELVPGRTVRDLVVQGPVPAEVAVTIAAQVAEALDAAHRAGLVHRDIKPANLLLVEDGPVPRVKVADFGVAQAQAVLDQRLSEASVTREGIVVGTARYLAPEQVAARPLDGRTDVYALGCVLHELLSGQPPFVRENDLAIALAHLTEPPPALRALGVPVEPGLEQLVLACLAKDPGQRPATALRLAEQLRALAAAPPTVPTAAVPIVDLTDGAGSSSGWSPPGGRAGASPATLALPVAAPPTPPRRAAAPGPAARPPRPAAAAPASRRRRHATRAVRRPTRSRAPFVVVAALVVAAFLTALAVVTLPTSRPPPVPDRPTSSVAGGVPTIASVRSFDPAPGDGKENDAQLGRLTDGDPTTTWASDRYNLRPVFGNLKKGLGLVVVLRQPVRLGTLRVRTATHTWAAQVYVADAPATTLSGWGPPVARESGVEGDLEVGLGGRSGGAVLLWFTDPGRTGQVVIGELEVDAP